MMKTYLFIYSDVMGDRDALKSAISRIPEITRWRYDIPNSFYLYSELSAEALTAKMAALYPGRKCFLFVEIANNRQGYLSHETWNFIKRQ